MTNQGSTGNGGSSEAGEGGLHHLPNHSDKDFCVELQGGG